MSKSEILHTLRSVRNKCPPKLPRDSNGFIIRSSCILHKYLLSSRGEVWTSKDGTGCLGGGICEALFEKFGFGKCDICPVIHKKFYKIANSREIKI